MTKDEALAKWNEACIADEAGIRIDNWRPIAHAMRHVLPADKIEQKADGLLSITRTIGEGDKAKTSSFCLAVK